jgi:hypothetical protein
MSYSTHALMENRNGLLGDFRVEAGEAAKDASARAVALKDTKVSPTDDPEAADISHGGAWDPNSISAPHPDRRPLVLKHGHLGW